MSATLQLFLRTLFLAIPHIKFSQLVLSNTALELPLIHTAHHHNTTLAASFLCTISSVCPNSVAPPPSQMVRNICWIFWSLHSIGMHSVTQHTTRRVY